MVLLLLVVVVVLLVWCGVTKLVLPPSLQPPQRMVWRGGGRSQTPERRELPSRATTALFLMARADHMCMRARSLPQTASRAYPPGATCREALQVGLGSKRKAEGPPGGGGGAAGPSSQAAAAAGAGPSGSAAAAAPKAAASGGISKRAKGMLDSVLGMGGESDDESGSSSDGDAEGG